MKKFFWFLVGLTATELIMKKLKKRVKPHQGCGTIIRTSKNFPVLAKVTFKCKYLSTKPLSHSWKRFFKNEPTAIALIGIAIVMVVFYGGLQKFSNYFQASTIEWEQEVKPFNGTVSPIEKVPNWVALSDSERVMNFDQIPEHKKINIPKYDLAAMKIGMTWRRDNEMERNTYITYPVPNLGNYQLDATENSGSHTGLDIKTLIGTPVRAISRGIITKSESQPTGFGQFVVIMHVDVPDPENSGQKTKLFSVYAHLSSRHVQPGDTVEKGEVIGKTGMTGMATAPHLHFQIDRDDAPFHPYWPFTWKDLRSTNIKSYFDAVKYGVNSDRAAAHTVHPMDLVVQNQNYDIQNMIVSADPTFIPDTIKPVETIKEKEVETKVVVQEKITTTNHINNSEAKIAGKQSYTDYTTSHGRRTRLSDGENIKIETDRTFRPGTSEIFDVIISEETLVASAGIEIGTTLKNYAKITPNVLTKNNFKNGVAQVSVTPDSDKSFKLIAKGSFGEIRPKSLRAQIFNDVEPSHKNQDAIAFVQQKKIMNGYGDGSFKPEGKLNRAEAVKILITANELSLLPAETTFTDIDPSAWFSTYVSTAHARGLVKGYGNGQFRPGNTISRAEFLKIAVVAANIDIPISFNKPYPDVDSEAWFAPYFALSAENNLLPSLRGGKIAPHQAITRTEAANVIWKILQLKK
jgi:hypothetical protein